MNNKSSLAVVQALRMDQRDMNFLEEYCDEITVTRDKTQGVTFALSFCHPATGCPAAVCGNNLREAVARARALR